MFGGQGWHGNKSFLVPAGAALFAATGEFVYGGPSPCFRGFRAEPLSLVERLRCVPLDAFVCQCSWIYHLEALVVLSFGRDAMRSVRQPNTAVLDMLHSPY